MKQNVQCVVEEDKCFNIGNVLEVMAALEQVRDALIATHELVLEDTPSTVLGVSAPKNVEEGYRREVGKW